MYAGHLDLAHPLAWTVDDALPSDDCAAYVEKMRHGLAEVAPIVGLDGPEVDLEVRNNTRVMWDDADEANRLVKRLGSSIPRSFQDELLVGGNPRLRLYRYASGEHHGFHFYTVVELPRDVRSRLTLVFYLNDDFDGGATDFPELALRVQPRRGRALLFQHRVLHAALPVVSGEKFVLRTDILDGPGA